MKVENGSKLSFISIHGSVDYNTTRQEGDTLSVLSDEITKYYSRLDLSLDVSAP